MNEFDLVRGDEHPLAKTIRQAIGSNNWEAVRVVTPQFERTDGKQITYIPKTHEEFDGLKKAPDDILKEIGMQKWDETLWLFPGEWYDHIPKGYIITDINGEDELFDPGRTDDDIRFGALAYGFAR